MQRTAKPVALARTVTFAVCLLLTSVAAARDMVTEVVPAGFRDAGELADILRPLIPSPGSIGAFHNQLVIKTTPENLAELRQLLASLDKAPSNLLVSVRRTLDAEISRDLAQTRLELRSENASAGIGTRAHRRAGASAAVNSGSLSAGVQVQQRALSKHDSSTQQVRVLEGKEAFIQSGESVPFANRQVIVNGAGLVVNEGISYEEFGSGFWARVRLNGERVTLDIYPDQRQLRGDGNASVQRTSTSVSGVLGRWMELSSVNVQSARDRSAIGSSRSSSSTRLHSTFVKVERVN